MVLGFCARLSIHGDTSTEQMPIDSEDLCHYTESLFIMNQL